MKISYGWVSEFVQLDPTWTIERISSELTDLGLEVEHVEYQADAFKRFVVGYVVDCQKHPKADKLSVCTVDAGEPSGYRTIVCGAANVAAGQFVPVALDGAVVPNGNFTIEKRTLRGIESNGMLCSGAELNLPSDVDGLYILGKKDGSDVIPTQSGTHVGDLVVGTPLAEYLGLTDVILDVAITPNRADCLSHIGIARELAAASRQSISKKSSSSKSSSITSSSSESSLINEVDQSLAPLYALQKINNVTIGESPSWMQKRLLAVGLRPRNVIVDVTNYVNMELGQPLHAFDYSKVRGSKFQVRQAGHGVGHDVDAKRPPQGPTTVFLTLDGKERQLPSDALMICDMERPLAIAGVMGGPNSEIDVNTTDIVLESAFFDPTSIRKTSRALGLSTDASYRFERGVDIGNVMGALERATQLILELVPGSTRGTRSATQSGTRSGTHAPIVVRFDKVRGIVGAEISNADMCNMFEALGCELTSSDASSCTVSIPSWRIDLATEIDMAEEVMRLFGINNIQPSTHANVSLSETAKGSNGEKAVSLRRSVRYALKARGYSDCVTGSLTSPEFGVVRLKNALGLEYSALRSSVLPSLIEAAAMNIRNGARTVRLCEIGYVYEQTDDMPRQTEMLAMVVAGAPEQHWSTTERSFDLYDLKGDLESIGFKLQASSFKLQAEGSVIPQSEAKREPTWEKSAVSAGAIVTRDLDGVACFAIEIPLAELLNQNEKSSVYKKVGVFPTVKRDVALVVDEHVTAQQLVDTIGGSAPGICRDIEVFDVFRDEQHVGAGRKSIAVALTFRDDERTLVDEEVEGYVRTIINAASKELGAHVRGGK